MKNNLKRLLLFISSFWLMQTTFSSQHKFKNFNIRDGLVHKTVNCFAQDSDSFIWIGTANGISRFDGYRFKNYTHDVKNPSGLHGTDIIAIAEGTDGKIWFSTDAGIEYLDKETETFHSVTIPEVEGNFFQKNLGIDMSGNIWLYCETTKFIVLDPLGQNIVRTIRELPKLPSAHISQFAIKDSSLWIASSIGILQYNYLQNTATLHENTQLGHCYSIFTAEDAICMAFINEGVYVFNTKSQVGTWTQKKDIESDIKLKSIILSSAQTPDSTLWIGMASGFIAVENGKNNFYNDDSREQFFDGGVVASMYIDKDNNLWFGTIQDGIYLLKNNTKYFEQKSRLFEGETDKTDVDDFILFDNKSLLYSNHKGIYHYPDYTHLATDCATQITSRSSTSLYPIDGNQCLISSGDSLFFFHAKTQTVEAISTFPAISYACQGADGTIWCSSWIGQVNGYNMQSGTSYSLPVDSTKQASIPAFAIAADQDSSLWLGTVGMGLLHIINPTAENPAYEYYEIKKENELQANSHIVQCLYTDRNNHLWIGTNGGGLAKLDKTTKQLDVYTTEDGLRSNIVESIISDNDGNIWFASSVLTKLDVQNKTFTHFSETDGVGEDFTPRGCAHSSDGKLLFSNSEGIVVFDPHHLPKQTRAPVPAITNLKIRGLYITAGDSIDGNVPYKKAITYTDKLSLPYQYNSFSLEFASIQFQASEAISYQYRLGGIDRDWIPADINGRVANYAGIKPGTYVFEVRALGRDGVWSQAKSIEISIIRPWYRTWLFISLVSFVLFALATSIVFLFRRMKRQNSMLEKRVTERIQRLEQTNCSLREKQLVMQMESTQLNEALESKDKLLNILAHDFKNPLNGIYGMATLLKKESKKYGAEKIQNFTSAIMSSSKSMLNQMMTLLEWVQSQDDNLEANPIEINLQMLIEDAIDLEKTNAIRKNISISIQADYESNAFVDPKMICMVFRNLLSNAIKFTPKGGSVTIVLQEIEDCFETVFIDSGTGTDPESIDTILNTDAPIEPSFGTNKEKGYGLGLRLSKSFIDKNAGSLSISSNQEEGTIFTVSLPKGKTLASKTKKMHQEYPEELTATNKADDKKTVLVIEDDKSLLLSICEVISKKYTVLKSDNGKNGLHLAQNAVPDVIVSDINLQEVSGIDICSTIKENELTCHIPILLITSRKKSEYKDQAYINGANDIIEKPLNPFHLLMKIDALLDHSKSIRQHSRKEQAHATADLPENYDSKIINKVVDFIYENLAQEKLSTNYISEQIGISRTQLWRIFKNNTNKSLSDFITEIRVQKAQELLSTGKYRISEISYQIGCSNPKYFSQWFHKEVGMSPTAYADQHKQL